MDFLAAAIESDSLAAFEDHSRWLARMLRSRDISPQHAAENFEQIRLTASIHLNDAEAPVVQVFVQRGCAALINS